MNQKEHKQKLLVSLQNHQPVRQDEIDDLVVEIIADAIRKMRHKKKRKN